MVIIDIVINTLLGGLTLDAAGMHCPAWDDAFVSIFVFFCHALRPTRCSFEEVYFEQVLWRRLLVDFDAVFIFFETRLPFQMS